MKNKGGHQLNYLRSSAFYLVTVISAVMFFVAPLQAEIDPRYKPQLEQLTTKLKAQGFTDDELGRLFSDNRVALYNGIVEKRGKGLNYFNRKFGLLTKKSIERGQKILREHRESFQKIEALFGVDKEVILGILRVETNFGTSTGNYPVFNSLLTMALIENRRSSWAEAELVDLLRICKEQNKDPLSIKGSWAGAFGICQFIPSSYIRFAVDGNNDGKIDLFAFHDAVASIANYLKAHGFEKNKPLQSREAVYAYNHCDNYVKAIFAYAKASKRRTTS